MSRLPTLACALIGLLLLAPAASQAVETTWTGGSGDWNTGANWNNGLPTASGTAVLNNGSTLTTPTGATNEYEDVWVGTALGEGGTIHVDGGLLSGAYGILGFAPGGYGAATVASGTWANTSYLSVGGSGTGNLEINGGTVTDSWGYIGEAPYSYGSALVTSGTWSSAFDLSVGHFGTGELEIDGGTVTSSSGYLGYGMNSHGSATVTSGTWKNATNLFVGDLGTGRLEIHGGTVVSSAGYLGYETIGHGSATVTSGTWSTSDLEVGSSGTGTLEINGGAVTNLYGVIGRNAGSHGSATVTSGTWSNAYFLVVGHYGTGSLEVSGGLVHTFGTTFVGSYANGDGTLTITGNEAQRGVLETWVLAKGASTSDIGTAKVHLDGGILRALRDESDFFVRFAEGDITVEEGGAYVDTNGFAIGINAPLGGTGALHKIGVGTLTLGGANTYSGGTVVETGTLAATHNQALGTGAVTVESGAVLTIQSGVSVGNAIHLEGGSLQRGVTDGASLAGALQASTTLGGATTVQFLDGVATGPTLLEVSFSATTTASNDDYRLGGVLSLRGVRVLDAGTGETDRFVLQLAVASLTDDYFLAWLDPETNEWVNAVLGNVGGEALFAGDRAYTEADFANLGTYGFDTANGTVWAVLNHNSDFAVVPEPGAWALLGLGAAVILRRWGRRATA